MNCRNKSLHDSIFTFSKRFFYTAQKLLDDGQLRSTEKFLFEGQKDWIYNFKQDQYPIWSAICNLEDITQWPEYIKCVNSIKKSQIINRQIGKYVGPEKTGSGHVDIKNVILFVPLDLLDEKQKPVFELTEFEKRYIAFETLLYSHELINTRITPIFGLDIHTENISLEKNIEIKKLDPATINLLYRAGIILGEQYGNSLIHVAQYAIFVKYSSKKIVSNSPHGIGITHETNKYQTGEIENRILQCLRLLQNGNIYPSGTIDVTPLYPGHLVYCITLNRVYLPSRHWITANRYRTLSPQKVLVIKKIWNQFHIANLSKLNNISTAINRFSLACERMQNEDRIIDLMISAEGLFLSDSQGELSTRLALSMAYFLAKSDKKRKAIYRYMKKLYGIRSNIVHGNKSVVSVSDYSEILKLHKFINTGEQYIRQAIVKYLTLSSIKKKKINFDNMIFNSF